MISIKSESDIKKMEIAGRINYETHQLLKKHIKPGVTTEELNKIAQNFIENKDATPSFLGYNGFPGAICTSINEAVVHGIPSSRKLKDGDIISIDIGVLYKGFHSDSAWTYKVGDISKENQNLMEQTKETLYKGLEQIKEGAKLSDITKAIEKSAKKYNLGIVKELVGHGVGTELHESPDIPNYMTNDYEDVTLKSGMTLAIEPMLTIASPDVAILEDDWTIVTRNGNNAAHYEHTVLVTKDGYKILTGE